MGENLMNQQRLCSTVLGVISIASLCGIVVVPAFAQQVSPQMLKACHDSVWEQPEFKDIPNAGVSIEGGKVMENGNIKVHWRVDWENNHARGVCVLAPNGDFIRFKIHANEKDWEHGAGPGIYYDTRSRRWKTDDGQVCHTCTEENGFPMPHTDGSFYFDPDIGKWRDSSYKGAVCHTCTEENGFETPRG
jgi:hypothetical protein